MTAPEAAPWPTELVARTEHEYVVPLTRPETVTGEAAPEPEMFPGAQVAV